MSGKRRSGPGRGAAARGAGARGFTLIELLVVMAIIGTLLALAVPRYYRSLENARATVLRHDLAILREAIDKYDSDLNKYPEKLSDLVDQRYIRAIPVDPITKLADTWTTVPSEDPDSAGIRDVHSGAETTARDGSPFATW
ncbi:MAG TPA: prepilin-type N-terminal cleavage/methylation domain-containing protein [Solirubrobacteraceae bacterium]